MYDGKKILELSNEKQLVIPNKTVLGLYEYIEIEGHKVLARIDSGAVKSSIDIDLASKLRLGPIVGSKIIRNVNGSNVRPIVESNFVLCNKKLNAKFTLQNRKNMNFKVLIGQNVLKQGFVIDPNKTVLKNKQEDNK